MDGRIHGYPYYYGRPTIFDGDGSSSGSGAQWGAGGGNNNIAVTPQLRATAWEMPPLAMNQLQYYNLHQNNFINFNYMRQVQHNSVVGWPHGGSTVPAPLSSSSFFTSVQPNQASPLSSTEAPPPTNSQPFFLGDALRGFFAIGQAKSPFVFCARNQAHYNKVSRTIKKHNVLQQILDRRLADSGFIKVDSDEAIKYIDTLSLPSSQPREPRAQMIDDTIATATATVKNLVNAHLRIEGHQIVGDTHNLLNNNDFTTAMKMLRVANIFRVECDNGFSAISCDTFSCNEVMIFESTRDIA